MWGKSMGKALDISKKKQLAEAAKAKEAKLCASPLLPSSSIGVAHTGLDCFGALLLRLGFVAYNFFIWSDRDRYCRLLR